MRRIIYTKELVLQCYNNVKKDLGQQPASQEYIRHPLGTAIGTVVKFYGSWNNLVKEAGDVVNPVGKCQGHFKERMVKNMRLAFEKRKKKVGKNDNKK